ncbi:MAG TPA: DUF3141 domain-containing protein [Burkholderiales bacterium]|nr:DUF3141 domain-containing protein [Burkholderiales bacterium]
MTGALPIPRLASDAMSYWVDAWQRTVLFWDILRARGNVYLDRERKAKPSVLVFDYEIIVDAREFEQPANYALARIKAPAEYPTDPTRRPFVVIDPRAGRGAGSGGSSTDSEIGVALRAGHPCYFVMFFPEPLPNQTVESVARAKAVFLQYVNRLHSKAEGKPFVICNCEGGWALMLLAAAAADLVGPILLTDAPISYWADGDGGDPLRPSGGLVSGTWFASLANDLARGTLDATQLAANFQRLSPANTYWTKLYNLYANVDTEGPRFLDFEHWWGGHFLLNREEMDWIAQNLFVGRQPAPAAPASAEGALAMDLRNIRSPIVVFASGRDTVTPPQQALGWITDLYESDAALVARQQVIVYCLHEDTTLLGIFVSTKSAADDGNPVSALDLTDTLPPGLYEAVIEDSPGETANPDLVDGRYSIRFEPRKLADLAASDAGRKDGETSGVLRRVAEINQSLYDAFVSPWVKAMSNEATAKLLQMTNPERMRRYLLSDLNPAMWTVRSLAEMVRAQRLPVTPDNPLSQIERRLSDSVERTLDAYRGGRDAWLDRVFRVLSESPWVAAAVGHYGHADPLHSPRAVVSLREELARVRAGEIDTPFEGGTAFDGWVRLLVWAGMDNKAIDERPFNLIRRLGKEQPAGPKHTLAELKESIRQQMFVLLADEERAIAALPKLIRDAKDRVRAIASARAVAGAKGPLSAEQEARFQQIEEMLAAPARRKVAND